MKRLALASILMSVGAYAACAVEEAPPTSDLTGGTGNVAGVAGANQGGSTAGNAGSGVGGSTGGSVTPTGGTTGGTITTGGTGGLPPTGGMGGLPPTGGMGGVPPTGGMGGDGLGGNGMGGMMLGGMGGMQLGGSGGMQLGGSGGKGGTGGSGGTTGEDLSKVGATINGHTILMPCNGNPTGRVCTPVADNTRPCTNPSGGPAASYAGSHSWNEQVTVGGTAGVTYVLRLRVQGQFEAKTYTGGTDANNSATLPANGLYTGGVANNSSNQYNIYFIRTDNPPQHYYLNSVGTSSDNRVRHSTFPADYEFDLPVVGGSTVCFVSADPNNSAIKNCAEPDNGSNCTGTNTVTVANLAAPLLMDIGSQPYNGQFVGVTVVNTTRM